MRPSSTPAALALAVLVACGADPEAPATEPEVEVVPTPLIEFAGCYEVKPDACVLKPPDRQLTIWIDTQAAAAVRVEVDGEAVEPSRHPADGGLRLRVELPGEAGGVAVDGLEPAWQEPWTLAYRIQREPAAVMRALELVHKGDLRGAAQGLVAAASDLEGVDRLRALDFLRKLYHEGGDLPAALKWTRDVATLASQLRHPRVEALAAASAAYLSLEAGDLPEAKRWVEVARTTADAQPEARNLAAYHAGLIAIRTGDSSTALHELGIARRAAERVGHMQYAAEAALATAGTLVDLGRGGEALRATQRSLSFIDTLNCVDQGIMLSTVGWLYTRLAERGLESQPPLVLFEAALSRVGSEGQCPNPTIADDARINVALAALEMAEPELALEALHDVEPIPENLAPWAEQVRARVALLTGRWELMPSLLTRPDPKLGLGQRWNALEQRALAAERFGILDVAVESHRAAEDLVSAGLETIGIDLGGELFLAGRQSSARNLVRLLVATGRTEQAMCRARLARGRALRRLDTFAKLARAPPRARKAYNDAVAEFVAFRSRSAGEAKGDWELSAPDRSRALALREPKRTEARRRLDAAFRRIGDRLVEPRCDELAAPRAGEAVVLLFPLEDGWIVFAADLEGVEAHAIAEPTPGDAAKSVLGPIAPRLARADRVRVLPTGRSWAIAFHALRFGEGVLVDAAAVSYALDLPDGSRGTAPDVALVVADPSEDLPLARLEADAVDEKLQALGWTVAERRGQAATRSGIASALRGASLLHYAGHGVHRGETGWDSALLLPEGDELSVPDILALDAVPRHVVLAGCQTGRVSAATVSGGMNLGRAFVLAGAESVVVVDERVDDGLARQVGEGLYARPGPLDLPAALGKVQRELRTADPTSRWAAFRAITR